MSRYPTENQLVFPHQETVYKQLGMHAQGISAIENSNDSRILRESRQRTNVTSHTLELQGWHIFLHCKQYKRNGALKTAVYCDKKKHRPLIHCWQIRQYI